MKEKNVFAVNQYGIKIRKCCASCKNKQYDKGLRLCLKGEGHVHSDWVCEDWEMSANYEKAGNGHGKVKKRSYLAYIIDRREEDERISLQGLRMEYEKNNGSIYYL